MPLIYRNNFGVVSSLWNSEVLASRQRVLADRFAKCFLSGVPYSETAVSALVAYTRPKGMYAPVNAREQ